MKTIRRFGMSIKKGNLPRFPIFINLKSNTMKNTVQRYSFYVIQHNNTPKQCLIFTFFKFTIPPILIKTKNKVFTWVFLAKTVSLYDF